MHYRWFDDDEEKYDDFGQPLSRAAHDEALHPREKQGFTRGEATGITLAALILVYGVLTGDVPLTLFCAAFLLFVLRPLVRHVFPARGEVLSNMMKGCAAALTIGALCMTFLF